MENLSVHVSLLQPDWEEQVCSNRKLSFSSVSGGMPSQPQFY